jgi:hypothetical protein
MGTLERCVTMVMRSSSHKKSLTILDNGKVDDLLVRLGLDLQGWWLCCCLPRRRSGGGSGLVTICDAAAICWPLLLFVDCRR